jgi:hypothetical protein
MKKSKTPKERAERALRHAPIVLTAKIAVLAFIEQEIVEAENEAIRLFVERVNALAEENMEKTSKLEGAHYSAMQVELKKLEMSLQ